MAKTKISEFNANPALNTDIDSINIAEGCAPSGINDAIRELMSQLKDWQSGTSNDPMVIGSSGSLTLNQGTANGVAYLNGSKVVTSGSALTFDGTNWKLGNPTTVSGYKAQIYGDLLLSSGAFGSGQTYTISFGDGNAFMQSENGQPVAFGAYNGFKWGFASTDNKTISSEWMRLTSTGLGIGTSSPAAKLHVVGNTRITADIESTGNSVIYSSNGSAAGTINSGFNLVGSDSSVRFYTGNSERMRLDSSGNLGLGVTPSAWSAFKAFEIASVGNSLWSAGSNDLRFATNHVYNGGNKYAVNGYAAQYIQTAGQHQFYTAASGTAGNAITFTQAMTLTAGGDLVLGTTGSSSARLYVRGSGTTSATASFEAANSSGATRLFVQDDGTTRFFGSSGSETARIDSSGNLLVGTTATVNAAKSVFSFSSSSNGVYLIDSTGVSGAQFMRFDSTSNTCGSITRVAATSAVTYNTTSDYRLKEVICAVSDSGSRIDALHPIEYTWKSDGTRTRGFLAHQFQEVYANSVTGTKDAVDADGNPEYQSMQAGSAEVIADLVAEIQSLRKRLANAGL